MSNKGIWILLIVIFFIAGAAGSFFLSKKFSTTQTAPSAVPAIQAKDSEDSMTIRLFFPMDNALKMEEKRVPARSMQLAVAEAIVMEYFRGPSGGKAPGIPEGVKLLGLYRDADNILYIDLSDDMRRNFQGDARAEYMLLKGLNESLISNLREFNDFKLLIEGKELESLGGHVYLKFPLKLIVSAESRKAGETVSE